MTDGFLPFVLPVHDPEGLAADEAVQGDLAAVIRRLVDLSVLSRLPREDLAEVGRELSACADRLAQSVEPGPLGLRVCSDGRLRDHGNPAVGLRNPIAPPMKVVPGPDHSAQCTLTLGAAYEGPPGHVHGGMVALVLDQVMGTVPALVGLPGMTAYLNVRYRRPTPLGQLRVRGWVASKERWKVLVHGEITDPAGAVTATAEGLFVVPPGARDHFALPQTDADPQW